MEGVTISFCDAIEPIEMGLEVIDGWKQWKR
jgi:hypothetical protein